MNRRIIKKVLRRGQSAYRWSTWITAFLQFTRVYKRLPPSPLSKETK